MSDFLKKLTQQPAADTSVAQVIPTTETSEPVAEVPQEPKKEAVIEPTELPTAPPSPAPTPVAPVVVPKDNNKQELERRRRRLMGY